MTANIQYKGTDIDSVYETPKIGAAATDRNYQVAGVDISNRFTALSSATEGDGNISTRIPPTGILHSAGTDLSSTFVGNPGQYSVTTLATPSSSSTLSIGATSYLEHQFNVSFSNAAALSAYFEYGGRILISASNVGSFSPGSSDAALQTTLASMGTLVIYDTGHYITGTSGTVNNPTLGGSNLPNNSVRMFTLADSAPYSTSSYIVDILPNAPAGSASVLTVTITITLAQAGASADTYNGTRTSQVQQRNYSGSVTPTQSSPTYTQTTFTW